MTVENVWVNGQFKQVVDYSRQGNTESVFVEMKDGSEQNTVRARGSMGARRYYHVYIEGEWVRCAFTIHTYINTIWC